MPCHLYQRGELCCCGCLPARDAAYLIGVLSLAFALVAISVGTYYLCNNNNNNNNNFNSSYINDKVAVALVVGGLVDLITASCLLYGIRKKKPWLMLPWLFVYILGSIASIVVSLATYFAIAIKVI